MGQNRTDTANQRAAKQRVADRRQCPRCLRRAALSSPVDDGMGKFRQCHYCGHEVGTFGGRTYGRDVTAEPGTRTSPATAIAPNRSGPSAPSGDPVARETTPPSPPSEQEER